MAKPENLADFAKHVDRVLIDEASENRVRVMIATLAGEGPKELCVLVARVIIEYETRQYQSENQ